MSEHEINDDCLDNDDDQAVDEELIDQDVSSDAEGQDEPSADIDEQTDAMMQDIKSDATYALRSHPDAEELDPDEIPSDAVVGVDDMFDSADENDELADEGEVDELPESFEISDEEPVEYFDEEDEEFLYERAARRRRRLRRVLVFFLIVLLILGAAIGVFVWRNSMSPDVKQPDAEALHTPEAGTGKAAFKPIDAGQVPDFATCFGMTPEEAAAACGGVFSLDAQATAAADATLPELKTMRNAWLVGSNGEVIASISFGLNQEGKIIYTLATFDLDAYGVADAQFDELAANGTVASSLLAGVGIDSAAVDAAQLDTTKNQNAVISRDTAGREQAEFSGSTNRTDAPTTWKITETYDHTAGAALHDNSVIRSMSIDLR